ncbi:MAG: exosortase/archaeosortase family protein, partial [Candidatus Omnitrophota bacterium]
MQKKALNYIIWGLTAALYSPIIYQLYKGRWDMVDYTHAYFILPISLWLVWRNRGALLKIETVSIKIGTVPTRRFSEWMGLSLFLTGLLIFIFGWRQDYLSMSTISLIPTLFGLTIYLYGSAIAKALSFPILYLLLMVPPPLGILDNITLPMRYWISVFTAHILKMFHYPITQSGLMLSLGGLQLYMGAPCSGFRSLITMISLGLVYVYIIKGKAVKKAILLGSIIPLALLGNLLRVIGMCLVTFHFGENIGTKFHDISGFVIFFVLILGLMGIDS